MYFLAKKKKLYSCFHFEEQSVCLGEGAMFLRLLLIYVYGFSRQLAGICS